MQRLCSFSGVLAVGRVLCIWPREVSKPPDPMILLIVSKIELHKVRIVMKSADRAHLMLTVTAAVHECVGKAQI